MPNLVDLLLQHKWFFLIGAEVSFWVLSAAFLALRYLLDLNRISLVFLALIILDNLFIAGLGLLDYRRTGEFATYQFIAAAIVVYGLTFGKQDFRRLDAYLKRRVARWKGHPPPPHAPQTRKEKAKEYRRSWYGHLLIFAVGQGILLAVGASWVVPALAGEVPADPSGLMSASWLWTVVFVVDTVWSLSYTVFPGQERKARVR